MPSPTTAGAIIRAALNLTNAVGVDQTLTALETSDCLAVLNDIQEDFSTQNLAVWNTANQTFSTVAGQAVYTIGTGGNWNTVRPVRINDPAYCTYQGVDFPVYGWDQAEYNLVGLKTQQQPIVQRYLFVNEYPLSYITLWPVPSGVVSMTFSINNILTAITSAGTSITFPPGYAKAFIYQAAVELAPLFGKTASDDVRKESVAMLANLKRVNRETPVSRFDGALIQSGPVIWQRGW